MLTKLIAIRGPEVSGRRFGVSTGLREPNGSRVVDVFGSYGCLQGRSFAATRAALVAPEKLRLAAAKGPYRATRTAAL